MLLQRHVASVGYDDRERLRHTLRRVEAERELLGTQRTGADHHSVGPGTEGPHRLSVNSATKAGGLTPYGCSAIHRADRVGDHVRSCALAVPCGRKVQVIVDGKDLPRRGRVKPEYLHTL